MVLPLAEIRVFPAPWAALSSTVVALYAIGVILAGGAEEGVAGGGAISGLDDGVEGVTGDGTFSGLVREEDVTGDDTFRGVNGEEAGVASNGAFSRVGGGERVFAGDDAFSGLDGVEEGVAGVGPCPGLYGGEGGVS